MERNDQVQFSSLPALTVCRIRTLRTVCMKVAEVMAYVLNVGTL